VSKVEAGGLDQFPLRTEPFDEHHQLPREEDTRVAGRPTALGAAILDLREDDAQIERRPQMAVNVVGWNEVLQGDSDRFVKAAGLGGAEHGPRPEAVGSGPARSPARRAVARRLFRHADLVPVRRCVPPCAACCNAAGGFSIVVQHISMW
jgi:hypothetical protein